MFGRKNVGRQFFIENVLVETFFIENLIAKLFHRKCLTCTSTHCVPFGTSPSKLVFLGMRSQKHNNESSPPNKEKGGASSLRDNFFRAPSGPKQASGHFEFGFYANENPRIPSILAKTALSTSRNHHFPAQTGMRGVYIKTSSVGSLQFFLHFFPHPIAPSVSKASKDARSNRFLGQSPMVTCQAQKPSAQHLLHFGIILGGGANRVGSG